MKFKESTVEIEGEKIIVRELSAKQRGALFDLHSADTNPVVIQANVVQMGCHDYRNHSIDDIEELPGTAVDDISKEILDISGLGDDSAEDAEKNS